ncbi:hypothetical protein [Streptomyces broussonetiae]|uniref:hypothetical protein n=1 Tax=Streptomyces broussonetiae TaxID=2686304 RepID=UPI001E4BDDFB|nr:hypothetical protein [Streptomyces broussonetiae]
MRGPRQLTKTCRHPGVGELTLDVQQFTVDTHREQLLVAYTAPPRFTLPRGVRLPPVLGGGRYGTAGGCPGPRTAVNTAAGSSRRRPPCAPGSAQAADRTAEDPVVHGQGVAVAVAEVPVGEGPVGAAEAQHDLAGVPGDHGDADAVGAAAVAVTGLEVVVVDEVELVAVGVAVVGVRPAARDVVVRPRGRGGPEAGSVDRDRRRGHPGAVGPAEGDRGDRGLRGGGGRTGLGGYGDRRQTCGECQRRCGQGESVCHAHPCVLLLRVGQGARACPG